MKFREAVYTVFLRQRIFESSGKRIFTNQEFSVSRKTEFSAITKFL